MVGCGVSDVVELVDQLPEVTRTDHDRYWRLEVAGKTFGETSSQSSPSRRGVSRHPRR